MYTKEENRIIYKSGKDFPNDLNEDEKYSVFGTLDNYKYQLDILAKHDLYPIAVTTMLCEDTKRSAQLEVDNIVCGWHYNVKEYFKIFKRIYTKIQSN